MRRHFLIGSIGFLFLGVAVFVVGGRSSLQAQQPSSIVSTKVIGTGFGGSNEDEEPDIPRVYLPPRSATIAETKTRLKLQEKIAMNFPNETPLQDVKAYLAQATIDKTDFPEGIPIYFDPNGLQEADKTMASTVQIELKNLPLETTLALLLKQVGLTYWVNKDGLLIVTADNDDLVTPNSLDFVILSNLSALRAEVRLLRSELHSLRGGSIPENRASSRTPPQVPMGGMGGNAGGFR